MPVRPKRPCSYPGCPELTDERYCDRHRGAGNRYYDRNLRSRRSDAFYKSKAWQAARQARLTRDNHMCRECLREGRITPANTVHHIVEITEDWSKRLDLDNLESLCASCHGKVEAAKKQGR